MLAAPAPERSQSPSILPVVAGVGTDALEPAAGERFAFGDVTVLVRAPAEQTGLAAAQDAGTPGSDAYAEAPRRYRVTWLG